MRASTSFRICLAIAAAPLLALSLGFAQFLTRDVAGTGSWPFADVCLLFYQRSLEVAGHAGVLSVAGLATFLLVRSALVVWAGILELSQIRRLPVIAVPPSESRRLEQLSRQMQPETKLFFVDLDEPLAMTIGYFKPEILLSSGLLDMLAEDELDAVLHHELTHARRRDPLRVLISDCCRAMLPFIPLVRYVTDQFRISKEVEADAEAIKAVGSVTPLASALSMLLARPLAPVSGGVGLSPTEARIDILMGRIPVATPRRTLAGSAVVSVFALMTTSLLLYALALSPHLRPLHICF